MSALLLQDFMLAEDPVTVTADPSATRGRGGTARLEVTVEEDHDAVMLVEQDGVYSWREPVEHRDLPPELDLRRSPLDRPVGRREISFELALTTERAESKQRGWLSKLAFSKVRVFVLKYVARKVVGLAVRQLESHIQPMLRVIDGPDPTAWKPLVGSLELPDDRPPRVLLLVHGTFSSTIGGFGHLGATAAGKKLLESFRNRYDLVLGYDHLTLSVDPAANAAELLSFLRGIDWPEPPIVDVVCHSRGALVTRSLIEMALPQAGWPATVDRVVYVGGVNAGTHLASQKNWKKLVDLYTNLAAAAVRLLPDAMAQTVLSEVIKGVGALVKLTVSYASEENGVPGLAAMNPDRRSGFIQEINKTQPGQPLPSTTAWFVIASDFEPSLALKDPRTLPKRLLLALADLGVDQLIGQANDLVVDTASMAAIDTKPGTQSKFVQAQFTFPQEDQVFHTIYFNQAETCARLSDWLRLGPPTPAERTVIAERIGPDFSEIRADMLEHRRYKSMAGGSLAWSPGASSITVRSHPGLGAPAAPPPARRTSRSAPPAATPRTAAPRRSTPRTAARSRRATELPRLRAAVPGAAGQGAEATVTAHLRASMAETAVVGTPTTVHVTISREALAAAAGISAGHVVDLDTSRPVTVQVVAKKNVEVVGQDRADVDVPVTGAPVDLYFDVMPLVASESELHVVARQGPVPLATLVLRPKLLKRGRQVPTTARTLLSVAEDMPPAAPATCVKEWLRITEQQRGDQTYYEFELQSDDLGILEKATSAPLNGSREKYVEQLYRRIEDRWVSSEGDSKQFMLELKALGGELFDELVPEKIGKLLWKHRKELKNVLILSDEPFIPWELVHLKNAGRLSRTEDWFLAQLGAMRWFQGAWPPGQVRLDKVRTCTPNYPVPDMKLEATTVEAAFLKKRLKATAVQPTSEAVLKVLSRPGSFDVFHFAGHGEADASEARILLQGRVEDGHYVVDDLDETTVAQYAELVKLDDAGDPVDPRGPRPMVVINACQAGRQVPKLTRIGGFARSMIDKGAGVFVSSLWSVGDEPATSFTQALYEALLDGDTLCEASIKARDAARKGDESTWLAYVVYGNPCATAVRTT